MFFISDTTGAQAPYTQELYQAERQKAYELRANRLEAVRDNLQGNKPPSPTSPVAHPSMTENLSASKNAAAVGTSAAGVHPKAIKSEGTQREIMRPSTLSSEAFIRNIARIRPAERLRKKHDHHASTGYEKTAHQSDTNPLPQRQKAIRAEQIMSTPVRTFSEEMTVREAGELFRAHRFRHVPVVSSEKKLVGIFSDRDYLAAPAADIPVRDLMATHVLCARRETSIRKIAEVFFQERIGAMPIVAEDGSVVGIVTRSDILCAFTHGAPIELWI
ncbi:CBS domain-containing protein [bacterium]|nr:CBS domain-containing protein [bacterium]